MKEKTQNGRAEVQETQNKKHVSKCGTQRISTVRNRSSNILRNAQRLKKCWLDTSEKGNYANREIENRGI